MITFGQLKDSGIVDVASNCDDNDKFRQQVNDATRRLMRRGDWSETAVPIYLCVFGGCIVTPRYVGSIRRLNICNHALPVNSSWYQFLPANQQNCWRHWRGHECGINREADTSVLQDVQGDGRLIRAYARCNADYGKTVTVFGTDNNGQPLQSLDSDGTTMRMGMQILLQQPFGSTSTFVRHIDYMLKDQTQCPVDVYAYNATTNLLEDIAHYDPSETTPTYARYKLHLPASTACGGLKGVLAMVKLRFIPVENDYDLVLVPNQDALELMIQAIRSQRAGDFAGYQQFQAAAINELNQQLHNDVPDEEFAATDNTLGPWTWQNQCF